MMSRFLLVLMSILLVQTTLTSVVVAGEGASSDEAAKKEAKAAFVEGRTQFEKEKFKEAANAFRRAYRLMPSWKLLFNIGQAEAAAGRYGLALESFERYLARGGDMIPMERRENVLSEITRLRAMVGWVEVEAPDTAEVRVDDVSRGTAPLPGRLKVTAGIEHMVEVILNGKPILRRRVIVSGGEKIVIEAEDGASGDVAASDVGSETNVPERAEAASEDAVIDDAASEGGRSKSSPIGIAGWVLTGTGAATLIGGGIAGLVAVKKNKTLTSECDGTSCDADIYDDNHGALKTSSTMATILIPTGAALAVAGVVLLVVGNKKQKESMVSILPVAAPQFSGLQIQGRF